MFLKRVRMCSRERPRSSKVSYREVSCRRIIRFKRPSARGQWRNQVERRPGELRSTYELVPGVLSALWSQSLCLAGRPVCVSAAGWRRGARPTEVASNKEQNGFAVRPRGSLEGTRPPLCPRACTYLRAGRSRPSSRNMMIAGCYHLQ